MGQRICSVEDCGKPVKGRGLCSKHIQRLRKYGTTELPPRKRSSPCVLPNCADDSAEVCHFPDCDRPLLRRGLCNAHVVQHNAGRELRPLAARRPPGSVGTGPCEVPGCDRVDFKRGLCSPHYGQFSKGRPLGPVKPYRPGGIHTPAIRDERGRKRCPRCEKWLPEAEFYKSVREPDGFATHCRACQRKHGRNVVYRRHSITAEDYQLLLDRQGGVCAICARECSRGHLSVDHDHRCCPGEQSCGKCIRGLLCRKCNQGLGLFEDAAPRLAAAAAYIQSSPVRVSR